MALLIRILINPARSPQAPVIPASPQFPFFTNVFISVSWAALGLCCCAGFPCTESRGSSLLVMGGPFIAVASVAAEDGL